MKEITLNTKLQELNLSKETIEYWNNNIVKTAKLNKNYHVFLTSKYAKIEEWDTFIKKHDNFYTIYNLFDCLNYVTTMEDANPKAKEQVCNFVSLLKKENIDFTNIIKETLIEDPENKHGWQYDELLPIYLIWLKNENKTISDDLIDVFITYVEKNSTHISYIGKNIESAMSLIETIKEEKLTHTLFKKIINAFSTVHADDDEVFIEFFNHINYDTQLKLYNFINNKFPNNIKDYQQYYTSFVSDSFYKINEFVETVIELDLFAFALRNGMKDPDTRLLQNLTRESIKIMSSNEFKENVGQEIDIKHFHVTMDNKTTLKIDVSINGIEGSKLFQKTFPPTLFEILKNEDYYYSVEDYYSGPSDVNTNLTLEVFTKYYLYNKFKSNLDSGEKNTKKIKL